MPWDTEVTMGVTRWFLDSYDLVIVKYLDNLFKDYAFCQAMAHTGLLSC